MKAWGGRFQGGTDQSVEAFTASISVDQRLWRQDLALSGAHAQMLAECGLLTPTEREKIQAELARIGASIEAGTFAWRQELEDVHMHIEAALIEALGDTGRKIHTARSRNDQVATGFRLWIRGAIDTLSDGVRELQRAFVQLAESHHDLVMPAYTHWQRAQPVLASHYLLAYVEKLERDRERLNDARHRVNRLPLGSAAVAGTSLPINRDRTAALLGFDAVLANSIDATGSRDFAVEAAFAVALLAQTLGGWADEWIVFNTTEFGFLKLPDAYCTGSSIMPQKKNPDVLELIRGKSAVAVGALTTLLSLTRSLPVGYSRDLQEDKAPVFQAFDTVQASIGLAALLVRGATFDRAAIGARLDLGFMDATALMEHLIRNGVPMREAHEIVGRLVAQCEVRKIRLAGLSAADWTAAGLAAKAPWPESQLGAAKAVAGMTSYGSTGPAEVAKQLQLWKARLI